MQLGGPEPSLWGRLLEHVSGSRWYQRSHRPVSALQCVVCVFQALGHTGRRAKYRVAVVSVNLLVALLVS